MQLYPEIEPYHEGKLAVRTTHTLHFEQVGNPDGAPVLFLHGGPGLGILPVYRRFFDPAYYRIILLDQRGAGRSEPFASLEENNTWSIVQDLEQLRESLDIHTWQVFGGSWGSLLALCYATKHPDVISSLVLRGLFLGRPQDLSWFYHGTGIAGLFPEEWQLFKSFAFDHAGSNPVVEDILPIYHELINGDDPERAKRASYFWGQFGARTSTLLPGANHTRNLDDDPRVWSIAKLENHFATHDFFMPTHNYIIENIDKFRHIPCHIIHGRYDALCPVRTAWDLKFAWPESQLHIVEQGGHSPTEPAMTEKLVQVTEQLKHT